MHTSRQCCPTSLSLVVENIPIKLVSIVGYLRSIIHISCNLSWALYINSVCSKVNRQVGLLPRVFILLAQV